MVLQSAIFIQALYTATYILFISKMSTAKTIAGFTSASLTTEEHAKLCHNFTYGNPDKYEFYSPNYPNNYPNNIKCVKRLEAPPGEGVSLDFRDQFHLEEWDKCENDRLEVRDGKYWYSPELGTFCGKRFPKALQSTGNALWLQFVSDDSIEHVGFRAVYKFFKLLNSSKSSADDCFFIKSGPSGTISKDDIGERRFQLAITESTALECTWVIEAELGKNISLSFETFSLANPNNCAMNMISMYPDKYETKEDESSMGTYCGTTAESIRAKSNRMHVKVMLKQESFEKTAFSIRYTVFRPIKKETGEGCLATEFDCNDDSCIDKSLICNDYNDCKYGYDEDKTIVCVEERKTKEERKRISQLTGKADYLSTTPCISKEEAAGS